MKIKKAFSKILDYKVLSIFAYVILVSYFIFSAFFGTVDVSINLNNTGCVDYLISTDAYDLKTGDLFSKEISLTEGNNNIVVSIPLKSKAISIRGCDAGGELLINDVKVNYLKKTHSLIYNETSSLRCAYCDLKFVDEGVFYKITTPHTVFLIIDHVWKYPTYLMIKFVFLRYSLYGLVLIFIGLMFYPNAKIFLKDKLILLFFLLLIPLFYYFEIIRCMFPPPEINGNTKAISASHYSNISITADYLLGVVIVVVPIIYVIVSYIKQIKKHG